MPFKDAQEKDGIIVDGMYENSVACNSPRGYVNIFCKLSNSLGGYVNIFIQ